MKIRVGYGYDVHQLADGIPFVIGGITVEHTKGPVAHSDGDVLIHSICDALLGAACLRDIGFHFPDTSSDFKDIDSKKLLRKTIELIKEKSFEVGNLDCTICLQKPKLKDYIPTMQSTLAKVMGIDTEDINIKATTTEKLGFEGREEGVSAHVAALIYKVD